MDYSPSFHPKKRLRNLVRRYGVRELFLPPYSPDLNPIEKVWANMKRALVDLLLHSPNLENPSWNIFIEEIAKLNDYNVNERQIRRAVNVDHDLDLRRLVEVFADVELAVFVRKPKHTREMPAGRRVHRGETIRVDSVFFGIRAQKSHRRCRAKLKVERFSTVRRFASEDKDSASNLGRRPSNK